MKRSVLILICILLSFQLYGELRFYREDLHFTLTDSTFSIDGLYFLRNSSGQIYYQRLFYPFPQDSLYGKVDTVFCENISRSDSSRVIQWDQKGAHLLVIIPTQDTTVARIGYQQKLMGGKAEYILETTSFWGRGFEQAYYDLTFPKTITIDSLSYLPDELEETETFYKLIWIKKDFLPLKNFIVEFK